MNVRDLATVRNIANVVGIVLLLAAVVPFVVYAVPAVVGADHSYVVLSGSMEPAISTGDAVVVAETDPSAIESGDVITYSRSGEDTVVTHRVIEVLDEGGERSFRTKGDANDDPDQRPVPGSAVVGTVAFTIPMIGHVVQFVGTPLGFGLLVVLPFGLLAVTEAWSFARSARSGSDDSPGRRGAGGDPRGTGDAGETGGAGGPQGSPSSAAIGHTVDGSGDGTGTGSAARSVDADASPSAGAPDSQASEGTVTISVGDLRLTTAVLVAMAPYTAYVALQLRTFATIAVAFAVGFAALALGGLWASLWHSRSGDLGALLPWSPGAVGEPDGTAAEPAAGGPTGAEPTTDDSAAKPTDVESAADEPTAGGATIDGTATDGDSADDPSVAESRDQDRTPVEQGADRVDRVDDWADGLDEVDLAPEPPRESAPGAGEDAATSGSDGVDSP